MKKIAFVLPRYIDNPIEGAEYHTRLLVEHLKDFFKLTVLTTKALDYYSWKNEALEELETSNKVKIKRFSVDKQRRTGLFNQLSYNLYLNTNHSVSEEISWMKEQGPYSSGLFEYLRAKKKYHDLFIFVGYNNPLTYFGLPMVKNKSALIPLTHKEPDLRFNIFAEVFSQPLVIIPSTIAEKKIIMERFNNLPPLFVIGVGIKTSSNILKAYLPIKKRPYILFIGRVSKPKGIFQLFDYFTLFKKNYHVDLDLVLIGPQVESMPHQRDIKYLGVVSEEQKLDLISNAEFIINPSFYESLSLVLLEAWSMNKPALVNAACEVLKSQVIQANGGLYYQNYAEFALMTLWFLNHKKEGTILGKNGASFLKKNYGWPIIEAKFKILISALT